MVWEEGKELQAGKYIIETILGRGGFGITYKALNVPLNHHVVIKAPYEYRKRDTDYLKYVSRFIKEAQVLARLSKQPHPNIVGVNDFFLEGDTPCLVMDYIPGKNLWDIVSENGKLSEIEAVKYIKQIGEALAFLHQAGLIHRDAYPKNIMLRDNGKAILIDFGIAGEIYPNMASKAIFGNQSFSPYEQMQGNRQPTVDIYSLAATLYYAVTGHCPTSALDQKLLDKDLIPPKQLASNITDGLNQSILLGMELEAEDRPQSIEDWLRLVELRDVLPLDKKKRIIKIVSQQKLGEGLPVFF